MHSLDQYRLLGASGLRVSPLSLGTMTFGNGQDWGADDAEAARIFGHYVDRGGNFIDTANFYGNGGSETVLGRLIAGRRDSLVISTKYSLTMRPGDPNASGNHRKNMIRSVEDSLTRLGTDHVDLLYLHMWDFVTPVEEIVRAFDDLVRQGKILYAGLSDLPAWQAARMQEIARLRGWSPFVALQVCYNLTERTVERELIPMAREMGMGVLPWSPLAGGVLSGKYGEANLAATSVSEDAPRQSINLATGRLNARNLTVAQEARAVASELGCTPAQVALAWTLLNPAVTSPVMGVRTLAQLQDNLGALTVELGETQIERLNSASRIDLGFPHELLASPAHSMMFGGIRLGRPR
ncbi:aldo/keto reductase [Sphingomonas sp. LaA6.9]|uniref:aldo/keto reductase n=1 Tax=Sphingomonas sp. LaA6.9 TaxID=2919914 RepID=UPI001F4F514A|nr:aldo/keto reductase [Sphingomonas sp. LaA6.9]MCJ8159803.1 aldo/keto reductase [Sphingomonas sp. LaA6.9]